MLVLSLTQRKYLLTQNYCQAIQKLILQKLFAHMIIVNLLRYTLLALIHNVIMHY